MLPELSQRNGKPITLGGQLDISVGEEVLCAQLEEAWKMPLEPAL